MCLLDYSDIYTELLKLFEKQEGNSCFFSNHKGITAL